MRQYNPVGRELKEEWGDLGSIPDSATDLLADLWQTAVHAHQEAIIDELRNS